jgi:hypothetical protein
MQMKKEERVSSQVEGKKDEVAGKAKSLLYHLPAGYLGTTNAKL